MGPAAEIAAFLHRELFSKLKAPVARVAGAFAPVPKHSGLLGLHYAGAQGIVRATEDLLR
jgi:pyruvate dehydrogenase E1 component beta subunit